MGRAERQERELRARQTINRAIPDILRNSVKARHGASLADVIVDPKPQVKTPTRAVASVHRPDLSVRVVLRDCLTVASWLSYKQYRPGQTADEKKAGEARQNVVVHNMASLTTRGGGFLNGANKQEEFLCARTTLWASLYDENYPLPNLGGIFSPDVLVFRNSDPHAIDLPKKDRFFVDVISAGVAKHPDQRGRYDEREASCSCGVSYCDMHRDLFQQKMKSVLRMAQMKGTKTLILGAWGCGSSNHPVEEVAKLWRKVIAGGQRQKRPNAEQWEGIDEIIFALPDTEHRRTFERVFDDVLTWEPLEEEISEPDLEDSVMDEELERLLSKAQSLELRIEQARNTFSRTAMKNDLRELNQKLALGRAARAARDDEGLDDNIDIEDDFVVGGYEASDGEQQSFYPLADSMSDSGSEDARSGEYEFRFGNPSDSTADEDELFDGAGWDAAAFQPSPQFDPETGWFHGTIDGLHAIEKMRQQRRDCSASPMSPQSPLVKTESSQIQEKTAVNGFLARFQRSDIVDQSE